MNVYDFDKTIYDGDSSIDFYFFCIKRRPSAFFKSILVQVSGVVLYVCKKITKEQYKEKFFSFLKHINVDENLLNAFWKKHSRFIKDWYLAQKKDTDIIISASPEFLLQSICENLNVTLIASRVNAATGEFNGKNCHGREKVNRLFELYPDGKVTEFYSDSKSDYPLAEIAEKAFLVRKQKIDVFPKDADTH